jgi:hypothetical protein
MKVVFTFQWQNQRYSHAIVLQRHEPKNNHHVTVNKYFQVMKVQTRFTENSHRTLSSHTWAWVIQYPLDLRFDSFL